MSSSLSSTRFNSRKQEPVLSLFVAFVFFVVNSSVVRRRFGLSGLLLAAWMTLIPSAGGRAGLP